MRVKIAAIVVCFMFSFPLASFVGASEKQESSAGASDNSIAMSYDQRDAMRRMLEETKPAAGVEMDTENESVESPRKVNYWDQKVFRRKRSTVSE